MKLKIKFLILILNEFNTLIVSSISGNLCLDLNSGLQKKQYKNTRDLRCLCDISRELQFISSQNVINIVQGDRGSNLN